MWFLSLSFFQSCSKSVKLAITIIVLMKINNNKIDFQQESNGCSLQIAYIAFSNLNCLCFDLFTLITNILYVVCQAGFWGVGCANVCQCASDAVTCEASSGRCVCEAGYTGDQCDKSESVLLLFILFLSACFSVLFFLLLHYLNGTTCKCSGKNVKSDAN